MRELKELSTNYATEKTNELMSQIVAQAFVDGYRMGYKDREEEIPVDLRDGKTEFVDLGLPSGTLWSADFEKDGEETSYLPYDEAINNEIPTKQQFNELLGVCLWEFKYISDTSRKCICIGPNGNHIVFYPRGYKLAGAKRESNKIFYWVKSTSEDSAKEAAYLYYHDKVEIKELKNVFSGKMMPLRLVRKK